MRTLLVDIETAPNTAFVWGLYDQNIAHEQVVESSYILCWTAKWYRAKGQTFASVQQQTKRSMLKQIHTLLDAAEVVIHYNGCVVAGNRVLTKDLRWVPVETLVEGDELLAFEETPKGRKQFRKFEVAKVVKATPVLKACSRITLSDGTSIIASDDHPWLTRRGCSNNLQYITTENLVGGVLVKLFDTWRTDTSYAAGYTSAFFDGEGCLSQQRRKRASYESEEYTFSCTFAQKDNTITKQLLTNLNALGIPHTVSHYDPKQPEMKSIRITGGLSSTLKFLGMARPSKISRINYSRLSCSRLKVKDVLEVVSVEKLGIRQVIGLETTSKTYIVEGFPCHNSKFDIPTLNKEFIKLGWMPPSPYKQVDLYQVVKRMFRFESNKMTAITKQLDLGQKLKHQGFELWVGCMKGDAECWKVMEKYNKRDVQIMEKLYTKLLPWIPNHPHQGLEDEQACPRCGVVGQMQRRGTAIARTVRYQRYQCQGCGGWSRARLGEKGRKPVFV